MIKKISIILALAIIFPTLTMAYPTPKSTSMLLPTTTINIEVINGGIGLSAVIRNTGTENLTNITATMTLTGGIILFGKTKEITEPLLRPDRTTTIEIPLVLGFGTTTINVTAESAEGATDETTMNARIRGLFTTIIPGTPDSLTAQLQFIAEGFKSPTVLTHAGDGSNRLFVADLPGVIYIIEDGAILPEPFLDVSDKIVKLNPLYDERGLLGLTFHPDYETNGKFYVYYSGTKTGTGIDHESIIAQYTVSTQNPNQADPSSEQIIMRIDQPEGNHNGGQLAFGPDSYLYIGSGDGGGAGDQHGTIGNGQDINTLLGKILRIDVDSATPYAIPPDNPFVGTEGLDEIYAYGFRNPYRFSFDHDTERLFVADVGQDEWEEISLVIPGGNYGWRILEGTHPYDPDLAELLNISIESLAPPIHEYGHTIGRSIIGGFMYRGTQYSSLEGKYVFGDWSTGFLLPGGKLYYLEETEPDVWERFEFQLTTEKPLNRFILGFGEDEQNDIYVLTTRTPGSIFGSGEVWKITIV